MGAFGPGPLSTINVLFLDKLTFKYSIAYRRDYSTSKTPSFQDIHGQSFLNTHKSLGSTVVSKHKSDRTKRISLVFSESDLFE